MSTFAGSHVNARFPACYRDAKPGLRLRVVDVTEDEAPEVLVTSEIGDRLLAALVWDRLAVTSSTMQTWGVSIDEAMATAIANVEAMPVKTGVKAADGASIRITHGHPWVSSLVIAESQKANREDGFLVAIPHGSVMITTPVTGAETVRGLEMLMSLCDELFEVDGTGVSPFVWWWYQANFWRVTDRTHDGSIDFSPPANTCAYHLAGAIEHLATPCAECGRE
jgi:hypothetical protein